MDIMASKYRHGSLSKFGRQYERYSRRTKRIKQPTKFNFILIGITQLARSDFGQYVYLQMQLSNLWRGDGRLFVQTSEVERSEV